MLVPRISSGTHSVGCLSLSYIKILHARRGLCDMVGILILASLSNYCFKPVFPQAVTLFCDWGSFVLTKDRHPLLTLEHQRRTGNGIVMSRAVTDCFKLRVAIMVGCNDWLVAILKCRQSLGNWQHLPQTSGPRGTHWSSLFRVVLGRLDRLSHEFILGKCIAGAMFLAAL